MLAAVIAIMPRLCRFAVLCLLLTTRVQAQPMPNSGVRLSFVRAENATDCIASGVLQSEVTRRMGYDPFEGTARQWIEGFIQRQAEYFELQLFERDAEGRTLGTRRLREQAGDCHKLDDAIVLAVALIIDPNAHLAPANPSESHASPPSPSAAYPLGPGAVVTGATSQQDRRTGATATGPVYYQPSWPAPRPHRESAAPTQQEISRITGVAFVAADAVVAGGVLPGAAFGAELVTRVTLDQRERFALRLSGLYLPQERQSTAVGDLGFGLTALEAGACVSTRHKRADRLIGFGCTGFGLGSVHTVVHSPQPYKPDDRLWAAFRLEIGAELRVVGPVWLGARLFDLVAPRLWAFRVVVNDRPFTAFTQKAFMPGAALGVGLHFD